MSVLHWRARRWLSLGAVAAAVVSGACAEVGSGPDVPAAIELNALPSPSVVIGDTLRTIDGVVAPVKAVVRNLSGDIIANANVKYLYADYARDSALSVDSTTGFVIALRASTADARLAARVGSSLQVIRTLVVTTKPDSMDREGLSAPPVFTTTLLDTGRVGAASNTSTSLSATVRHLVTATTSSAVNAWPVRFELVSPANPTNDTTKSVYLVDDQGRASTLDTTDASGLAGRKVRIRAAQYPAAGIIDSVIVRATATYRGVVLKGAPVRIALPVKRGT